MNEPSVAINVAYLITALAVEYPVLLGLPFLVGWWLRRRLHIGWGVFFLGALTFVLSQVGHIPFNWATGLLEENRWLGLLPLPWLAIVAGLSAGIFEEGARWLMLSLWARRTRGWAAAVQYGAGHEAAESVVVGLIYASTLVSVLLVRLDPAAPSVPPDQLEPTRAFVAAYWGSTWYTPALIGLERISTYSLQILFAVLVMRAVVRRRPGYLLAAVLAHALVDAFVVQYGAALGPVGIRAGVLLMGLAALWLILRLREPQARPANGVQDGVPAGSGEIAGAAAR